MGHLLPYIATTAPGEFVPNTESTSASGSPPTTPPTTPTTPPATSISASSRSVLLVENDPSLLNLLRRHLKEMGYTVRTALNAEEGLRLYRDCAPFNVVLIDYCVPESFDIDKRVDYCSFQRNGTRLAKAIRTFDPSQRIVILALDFRSVEDVPRPSELMNVPLLVDISAPRLRVALEKIEVDRAI